MTGRNNGYYGSMTKTAVVRFQRQHGLSRTASGKLTGDAIMASNAQHYALMNGTGMTSRKSSSACELPFSSGQITGFSEI